MKAPHSITEQQHGPQLTGQQVGLDGATQVLNHRHRPDSVRMPKKPDNAPEWTRLPLFADLEPDALELLRQAMEVVEFVQDEVLMRQGENGGAMFVLDDGMAHVRADDDDGQPVFERDLPAPAIVGEMALITNEPRSATVYAVTPIRALRIDRATLEELCRRNPQAAVVLTCLVGERLLENRGIRKVGKYEVLGRLGSGGVATVFEAMHPGLGRSVALKMLSHALVFDGAFAEHFGREGRLVAQLNHDNIVRVLDTEEAYGTRFIVMEKLTGDLLESMIHRRDRPDWPIIRRIIIEISMALAYSHEAGLIHRDVKPSNVFMTEDKRVKLLDFGIAVQFGMAADLDGKVVGTPYYMSPEQITGQQLDGRSDLYSLGIVAYELCTHELPFTANSVQGLFAKHLALDVPDPRLLDPDIPEDMVDFIRIATAKNRDDRFSTCREAGEWLQRAGDLPSPDPLEISSLALTYMPSRRSQVQQILREAVEKIKKIRGVSVFQANQVDAALTDSPRRDSGPYVAQDLLQMASGSAEAATEAPSVAPAVAEARAPQQKTERFDVTARKLP